MELVLNADLDKLLILRFLSFLSHPPPKTDFVNSAQGFTVDDIVESKYVGQCCLRDKQTVK